MSYWLNGLQRVDLTQPKSRLIPTAVSEGFETTKTRDDVDTLPSRWFTLAAALVFLAMSGIAYSYALVSETLKNRLNLRQSDVDTIAIFGTIGANSGVVAGIFYNRFGPSISIRVGVALTCIGYALLAGITTEYLHTKSVLLTCFANFLFNHGTAWFSACSTPLIVTNFPEKDHGKLLGLGKGYLGIGSAFFAAFKSNLANGDVNKFMASTLIFMIVASFLFTRFIVQLPPKLASGYLPNEINHGALSVGLWYIVSFLFAFCFGVVIYGANYLFF